MGRKRNRGKGRRNKLKESELKKNIRVVNAALAIAGDSRIRLVNGSIYLQGKLINQIIEKIAEVYQQYVSHQKEYNPEAKFPEEIHILECTEEIFFPLLHFQNEENKPFKVVIGLKLEENNITHVKEEVDEEGHNERGR
jgi:hypothetical protein